MKKLFFYKSNSLWSFPPEEIVYIKAEGNYSTVTLHSDMKNGKLDSILLTFQLGHIEDIIYAQLKAERITGIRFVRVGRSLIINCSYIHHIDPSNHKLILSDAAGSFSINLLELLERKKDNDPNEKVIRISKDTLSVLKGELEISLIGEIRTIIEEETKEKREKIMKRIYER